MNARQKKLFAVTLALMALAAGLILGIKSRQRLGAPGVKVVQAAGPEGPYIGLPEKVPGYVSQEVDLSAERGALPKDTTFGKRLYSAPDGFKVLLTTVLMGTDRTSIHRPEFCLTGQGWQIDQSESELTTIKVARPFPYALPVNKTLTTKVESDALGKRMQWRGIYVYWFVADGKVTARNTDRMWSMGSELLRTGVLQRWAYISCFSSCAPGEEEATYQRMASFIAETVPQFQLATGTPAENGVQTALRQ